jgi:hypothetical protein
MTAVKRKAPFRLAMQVRPEHSIQKLVCDVLRIELAPAGKVSKAGVCWFSSDIADYGGAVPGIRMARGLIAGVPDIFLLYRGQGHFIELKTDIGELSVPQQSVMAALMMASGRVGIARDEREVVDLLDVWAVPRAFRVQL